jgi:hypothetical protein
VRDLDAGGPAAVRRAIARAIAKDRSQRQATAGELETELRSALRAQGIASTLFVPGVPTASDAIGSASPRGPLTAAERTAATMLGESTPTGVEDSAAPQNVAPPANIPSQAATMPTVIAAPKQVEPAGAGVVQPTMMVSSQLGGVAARSSAPSTQTGGRSALPFVAVGIVVLLLVVGAGGYAVIHFMGASANNNAARADSANSNKRASGSDLAAGAHEVGRYWVEVNTPNKSEAVLAGESLSMKSLQQFKFHFSPSENGYLYIIGPGQKNAPTTFLTTKQVSGLKIAGNEIKSGEDFAFPAETNTSTSWLNLDQTAGTDEFTLIYSTSLLSEPAFLNQPAGHELTQDEQRQLETLRQQNKANSAAAEVVRTGASPFVSVKVPQNAEGSPVIFMVRLEHK